MRELLTLAPGILTLTFVQPEGMLADAVIRPVVPAESLGQLTLMFEAGNASGTLSRPGEICIIRCNRESRLAVDITAASGEGKPVGGLELVYLSQDNCAKCDRIDALVRRQDGRISAVQFGEPAPTRGSDAPITGLCLALPPGQARLRVQDMVSGRIAAPGNWLHAARGNHPFTDLKIWVEQRKEPQVLRITADFAQAGRIEAEGTVLRLRGNGTDDPLLRIGLALLPESPVSGGSMTAATEQRGARKYKVYGAPKPSRKNNL
ncbi:hypothetical protein C8J30_1178 [Rhodobacter viridis]|uniref:Uncharacterized protein n=1 Tax=Rhodobacter viridis TaxID=1054202 RepID=A0A318TUC5_9RHOB|nr:hypothetical protein [Rhodobacter viridis]PYF07457.1 hypothetical protein C8J30_1178 [Rhodobacter viridis]